MLLQLNVYPGLKGLKEMLGTVPAWIHYEERERVEVRCLPEGGSLTIWWDARSMAVLIPALTPVPVLLAVAQQHTGADVAILRPRHLRGCKGAAPHGTAFRAAHLFWSFLLQQLHCIKMAHILRWVMSVHYY